jgi:hypothetical protein
MFYLHSLNTQWFVGGTDVEVVFQSFFLSIYPSFHILGCYRDIFWSICRGVESHSAENLVFSWTVAKGYHGCHLVTRWDSLMHCFVILKSLVYKWAFSSEFLGFLRFFDLRRRRGTLCFLFGNFGCVCVWKLNLEVGDLSFEIYVADWFRLLEKLNFFFSFSPHHFLKVDYLLTQVFQLQVVGRLLLSNFTLVFTFSSIASGLGSLLTFLRTKSLWRVHFGCKS